MKHILFLFVALGLLTCCKTTTEKPAVETTQEVVIPRIEVLDVPTFKDEISNSKVQLVDVRTPEEYAEGHIKNARNIDFLANDFSKAILKVDKDQPVYIYCRSGNRSGQAAQIMQKLGYKTIYDLKGGFLAWNGN